MSLPIWIFVVLIINQCYNRVTQVWYIVLCCNLKHSSRKNKLATGTTCSLSYIRFFRVVTPHQYLLQLLAWLEQYQLTIFCLFKQIRVKRLITIMVLLLTYNWKATFTWEKVTNGVRHDIYFKTKQKAFVKNFIYITLNGSLILKWVYYSKTPL